MKSSFYVNRFVGLTALVAVMLVGCQKENPTTAPSVNLGTTTLGQVLTGVDGKTLYFFAPDVNGDATCTGGCADTWPVFYAENLTLGNSLKQTDFGTITRADNTKQTTFKGWPLYYYRNDAKAGDIAGENIGNVWQVAKPNYTVMLASRQLVGNDGKNYTFDTKEGTGNSLFLVDSLGRTLYGYANDKFNVNKYTKADLGNNPTWPIFEATKIGEIPSALKQSDFAIITVPLSTPKKQMTFKGWPLYYFDQDVGKRGNTKGVSVPRPGVWPVVNNTSVTAPN